MYIYMYIYVCLDVYRLRAHRQSRTRHNAEDRGYIGKYICVCVRVRIFIFIYIYTYIYKIGRAHV